MGRSRRITGPLLDVLEVLVAAFRQDEEPHGWTIMKAVGRSGPTVYGVLERLEEWGWITGTWEELPADESRPRRRFYRLTPSGRVEAVALLAERRPTRGGTALGEPLPGGGW
ncbi:PadR family transcriptional regulator [Saccharothrix sp. BKS2]|uniref:PadR family transcriptional regulator n=1 Tax=Saccharothrix sp. BKS2 TaxID=3064400 RepID=UPI0039E8C312